MKLLFLILLLFISLVSPVLAWNEPDGFAGFKWGTPPEPIMKEYVTRPDVKPEDVGTRLKRFRAGYAVGNATLHVNFMFLDGGFAAADFSFELKDERELRQVFLERYGTPTTQGPILTWIGKTSSVSLGQSSGVVSTSKYLAYSEEQRKQKIKEAAKKL